MNTRKLNYSKKSQLLTKYKCILFGAFILLSRCGLDSESQYGGEKIFDRPTNTSGESGNSTPESEGIVISPNKTIYNSEFQGHLNYDSVRVFTTIFGKFVSYTLDTLPRMVRGYVPTQFMRDLSYVPVSMEAMQKYGDGITKILTQKIDFPLEEVVENSDDDQVKKMFANGDTFSGVSESLSIAKKGQCPDGLSCVKSVIKKPNNGEPIKLCYFDTYNMSTQVPLAVSPTAERKIFEDKELSFGPFKAVVVSLEDDCEKIEIPDDLPLFKVRMEITDDTLSLFDREDIPFDYGMKVHVSLLNEEGTEIPSNTAPFVDTELTMQSLTVYYVDEDEGDFVRVLKRFFLPVASFPVSINMKVDGLFQFCRNLLNDKSPNFCL